MITIGFTGKRGKDMVELCDRCLVVPSATTARIQEAHILIGHAICELVELWSTAELEITEGFTVGTEPNFTLPGKE
jgi:D-sedoheptulose 7-phosphate isomerase